MTALRSFDELSNAVAAAIQPAPAKRPVAANDNFATAVKMPPPPRYTQSLPALAWLHKHDPILAEAMARAMPKAPEDADVVDTLHEIRPTIGELIEAVSDAFRPRVVDGKQVAGCGVTFERHGAGRHSREWIHVGSLRFFRGELQEWGVTKKGKSLKPVERITARDNEKHSARNPAAYLRRSACVPSPMHADSLHRAMSNQPAIPSFYDPLPGVEQNRRDLAAAIARSPDVVVTKCPTAIAKNALFLGGVVGSSGTASQGGPKLGDLGEPERSETRKVTEEVAARGTLKSIGIALGYSAEYADRAGRKALIEAASLLVANDNRPANKIAA